VGWDIFPDAELLACTVLGAPNSYAEEGWGPSADKPWGPYEPAVGTAVPANADFSRGVIVVARIGGIPVERHRVDTAMIQLDVWADTKSKASGIARRARQILHAAEGQTFTLGSDEDDTNVDVVLTGTQDTLGLAWIFDPINIKPRYTFGVALTLHNAA
jgi:hypothetical protein